MLGKSLEPILNDNPNASILTEACFKYLEQGVLKLQLQKGYGKDKFRVYDAAFKHLRSSDPERFESLIDMHKALPDAAPYIGYY